MQKNIMTRLICLLFVMAVYASTVLYGQPENYYAPWHCRINDSTQMTVSKFGHYVSFGFGGGNDVNVNPALTGHSTFESYSLAYKSHQFSLTHVGFGNLGYSGGTSTHPYLSGEYFGFLYGESVRAKNLLLSLSTGIAYSNTYLQYFQYLSSNPWGVPDRKNFDREGVSFPIELKLFLLSRNGIGLGIHMSKNIIFPVNFSPFCWSVSIVFGKWNKRRVKK